MESMWNADDYTDFYVVVESATDPEDKFQILKQPSGQDGLNFLRFRTCLQSFGIRNRNQRLWQSNYMKPMLQTKEVKELITAGGIPGENGHPVPDVGQPTMERILTIDPERVCHVIKNFEWVSEKLYGIIETIDDGEGCPGRKFMRNILQGLPTSFSTRSIIPQRKNQDGTIDQTGIGRYVTSDRVFLPSHDDAYMDKSFPVKNVVTKNQFQTCMESFVSFVGDHSDKVGSIVDGLHPAMESATVDKNGILTVGTDLGTAIIYPESKFRNEWRDYYNSRL